MKRIAIYNQKGGVGKTTTAICLSGELASRGKRVLVVDVDPQTHATLLLEKIGHTPSLFDIVRGSVDFQDAAAETHIKNVDVIAGNKQLARIEHLEGWEFIDAMTGLTGYDYMFLDCGPALGPLNIAALASVQHVLVPVEPSTLSAEGLADVTETIATLRRDVPSLELLGVVMQRVHSQWNSTHQFREEASKQFGDKLFSAQIRMLSAIQYAADHRLPVCEYEPNGEGAKDYRELATEIISRVEA